ncbi:hypothetical protein [Kitasatospora aureofaciens]|uniref:hypothetical protein n=1 Tax=Kitasatospora aureofaciens TaxID=1894 RepID=UPI001D2E417A|nr:hypothetical protein [Kitasatospora aureofaciens]HJD81106.1 hypothetical protein [Kitasatospora aureofaciens]
MVGKRTTGIYPYIGLPSWGERLADAVENTCEDQGLVPPPRAAITQGLATALGETEIKKLISTSRGRKILNPTASRVVQSGNDRVLLLICDVHGAAVAPWDLNDRTVGIWSPPSPAAVQRVAELIAAETVLDAAEKARKIAIKERDARRRAPSDDAHYATALAAAETKLADAARQVRDAEHRRAALLTSLGNRLPRPVVRAAEEDGQPMAALVLAEQTYEQAVHVQRYAASHLERFGKTRGYDLAESMVAAGQLSRGMSVLQQWRIKNADGTLSELWRMVAVTANNRALARLNVFGLRPEHIVTGMPRALVPLPSDKHEPGVRLLNQREALNRLSQRLNEADADEDTEPEHTARRAAKIATVPMEIVVGCSKPAALEHVLRGLNVNDHLRGIQPYDEEARLVALFATLVDAYAQDGKLVELLDETFPMAQGADLLDLDGVRNALTANGPLDPLAALLPAEEKVSPAALRDVAVRAITALVFPEIPSAGPGNGRRQVRDTGAFWPIVRASMQEPAWSQTRAPNAENRTRLWSAAVAQLFLHRANILSALGLFTVPDAKEGTNQDPRSLKELLLRAEAGEPAAWAALVRRMVPALIHAPQPLITPGQGSEAGAGRKGVRRSPANAVAALTMAYTAKAENISRALLLAFARSVLEHPDAVLAPNAPDGGKPVCYGEREVDEDQRSPIVPGMILVPDLEGAPTGIVVDKAWFDDTFPPDLAQSTNQGSGSVVTTAAGATASDSGPSAASTTANGQVPQDPRDRLVTLRREMSARVELVEGAYQRAIAAASELTAGFNEAIDLRAQLGEEPLPADQRIQWMEKLTALRDAAQGSAAELENVEALILKL